MGDNHPVAALDAFGERPRARDFDIIGMATYSKNIHLFTSFQVGFPI
jgi:hypothetical protein